MAYRRYPSIFIYLTAALGCVLWLAPAGSSQAALLGLARPNNPPTPDITVSAINVSYNSGLFKANGFPIALDLNFLPPPDFTVNSTLDTDFLLQLNITPAGVATGGTITIKGGVPALGIANGTTLLTGNLKFHNGVADFGSFGGAGSTPDLFDMIFTTTGGALFPTYYHDRIDVILTAGVTPFTGSFASSFANDGFSGVADVVPEPESVVLAVVGAALVGLGPLRRRLRKGVVARG